MPIGFAILTDATPLIMDGEQPPRQVVIVPDGRIATTKGEFTLDAEGAAQIIREFDARRLDRPIDYEHQSLPELNTRNDGLAPAAGFIKSLAYEAGRGLIAVVSWTTDAAKLIMDGAYRYLSPVLALDDDRRAIELHSAALTNLPAINDFPQLAYKERMAMALLQSISATLSLAEGATEKQVLDRVKEILRQADGATQLFISINKRLGLDEKNGDAKVVESALDALTAKIPADGTVIPMKDHEAVLKATAEDVAELKKQLTESRRTAFMARGVEERKIAPETKESWTALFDADEKLATETLEHAPVLLPPSGRQTQASTARPTGDPVSDDPAAFAAAGADRMAKHKQVLAVMKEDKISYEAACMKIGVA